MRGRPADWTPVVRTDWKRVVAYIVSSRHPSCIRMAQDEAAFIKRNREWLLLGDVPRLKPTGPWFMAVVVCPGDGLADLARWGAGVDAGRVHFYLHADADPKILSPCGTQAFRFRGSSLDSGPTGPCTRCSGWT